MNTKLEMMVRYLAGRQGEAAEWIRRELADPRSDVSRCLQAVRSRSRGIFGAAPLEPWDPVAPPSTRDQATPARVARRRRLPLLFGASAAALVLIAVGAAWQAQDGRLRHLEAVLARREARWGDRFNRLEATLTRPEAPPQRPAPASTGPNSQEVKPPTLTDGPTRLALARLETRLDEIGQRLGEGTPSADRADPQLTQLRSDLDRLKQEVESASRAGKQEMQELTLAVREVLHLLRRLAMRSRVPEPLPVPVPIPVLPQGRSRGAERGPGLIPGPVQGPNPGQIQGQAHSHPGPSQGNQDWGTHGLPGGHTRPGMPAPQGPG
jgi:hypothetical protein